jgi:hypothetical protein
MKMSQASKELNPALTPVQDQQSEIEKKSKQTSFRKFKRISCLQDYC